MTQTRRRRSKEPKTKIEHHHLLVRMETKHCPSADQVETVKRKFQQIIHDIRMKALAPPIVRYLEEPKENKGMTGIMPIETSHIAFHFWDTPEKSILTSPESKCLLQFDLYTCGTLSHAQIAKVLQHMTCYSPVSAEITLLNRLHGLAIEKHVRWNKAERGPWDSWLRRFAGLVPARSGGSRVQSRKLKV